MTKNYDIVTIGGGLAGSALAKVMAERGARVLVVERETAFRDRVRGEQLASWGAAEARELGIYDLLTSSCAHELRWWDIYVGPARVAHRDLPATTPQGIANLAFYHPQMQETLIAAAAEAGAEVRRGAKVTGIEPGLPARVKVAWDDSAETVECRMVAATDGRNSVARKWGGFQAIDDPDRLQIAGLLFDGMAVAEDTARLALNLPKGKIVLLFPQGGGRVRAYITGWKANNRRFQGEADIPAFVDEFHQAGLPPETFEGALASGPLATFDGADSWVEHPYGGGIALLGDAAATSDPCWGQGLSLTLRDVRTLRDKLLETDDWDVAGHAYAEEHQRYYATTHTVEDWFTQLLHEPGPEADARRARVFSKPLDEATQPDAFQSGPESVTADEATRRRFFAENQGTANGERRSG